MSNPNVHLGEIVDINDPMKMGRARVRVFGFFDELATEDIPWAEQISGLSFSSSRGNGNISVPRLGAIVNVQFDGPNYYKIFYEFEKETSPALLEEISDSYEGAQSIWYDEESDPGPLKLFYTKKKGVVLSLGNSEDLAKIQLDTNNGNLRIVIQMGDDEIRMENRQVIVNSRNIKLGENAIEALIKGNTFQAYFNSHVHVGNLGAPTSPPVIPSTPDHLSTISKTQ